MILLPEKRVLGRPVGQRLDLLIDQSSERNINIRRGTRRARRRVDAFEDHAIIWTTAATLAVFASTVTVVAGGVVEEPVIGVVRNGLTAVAAAQLAEQRRLGRRGVEGMQ